MMDVSLEAQLRRKLGYATRMLEQVTLERDIAQKALEEAEAAWNALYAEVVLLRPRDA